MLNPNDLEYIQDQLNMGNMTAAEANVEIVRFQRVKVVSGIVPRDVRSSLNNAVKSGSLCHMKKDGIKPECYYHPSFEHLARQARAKAEQDTIEALLKVCT